MTQAAAVPRIVQNRSETAPPANHQTNLPVSQNIIQAKRNTCSYAFMKTPASVAIEETPRTGLQINLE